MNSPSAGVLRGVQSPRVALEPRAKYSEADDAAFLASSYGLVPDEWQMRVLRAWMGVRPDGQWAARRCGLSVPRQNGKNGILEVRELFGMVVLGEKFLHTAHEVKTARKAFLRLASFFENEREFPELAALVVEIRKTNGQEAVVLANGGSCEFVARSKGSARGFTVDVLVMDEAQELGEDAIEALLPTISAAPLGNPQQIFTGTPPGPKANGEIFTRVRSDGLEGKDKALAWHEWSAAPKVEGTEVDLDDPANLAAANPALGFRLQRDVTDAERGTLSDSGFGRERLGMWDEVGGKRVIPEHVWAACADEQSLAAGRLALAVDVSPDRSVASVSVAGQRADGDWHVELDEQRNGTGWIVAHVKRRCEANDIRAVVIDLMSPAASLIDEFQREKIKVSTTSARDMAQACGAFYDGAVDGSLHHIDQPQVNAALGAAGARPIGDGGWGWNRKSAALDITALVACTLALWGAQTSPSKVKKPARGGRGRVMGEGRRAVVV